MASVCAVTADRRIVNIWAAVLPMVKIQAPVALDYLEVGSLLEGHDLVGLDDAKRMKNTFLTEKNNYQNLQTLEILPKYSCFNSVTSWIYLVLQKPYYLDDKFLKLTHTSQLDNYQLFFQQVSLKWYRRL